MISHGRGHQEKLLINRTQSESNTGVGNTKALILSDSLEDEGHCELIVSIFEKKLRSPDWRIETISLQGKKIGNCLGCFGCWVKTPGECVRKDFGQDIARTVINSDMIILVGPVSFGGYSSGLKKAVDRFIPLILPFFQKVDGEIHHKPRYDKYPRWVNIGLLLEMDSESEGLFTKLLERNAINFFSPAYATGFVYRGDDEKSIEKKLDKTLKEAEVEIEQEA